MAASIANRSRFVAPTLLALLGQLACATDKADFVTVVDQSRLLASVQLSQHAYNVSTVAPYDTFQLHVTAYMADGSVVPATTVKYSTVDPSTLNVDSTGFVTAMTQNNGCTPVTVAVTYAGVTRKDSAYVGVISSAPPTITGIDFAAAPGDTATLDAPNYFAIGHNLGQFPTGGVLVSDGDSSAISSQQFCASVASRDTTVVRAQERIGFDAYTNNFLRAIDTGRTWVSISMFAYGKTFSDSVRVSVGLPHVYNVKTFVTPAITLPGQKQIVTFRPDSLTVTVGADVVFIAPDPTDPNAPDGPGRVTNVTFDNTSGIEAVTDIDPGPFGFCLTGGNCQGSNEHPQSGNIPNFRFDFTGDISQWTSGQEARRFSKRGTYHYHNADGATGVIVVQ